MFSVSFSCLTDDLKKKHISITLCSKLRKNGTYKHETLKTAITDNSMGTTVISVVLVTEMWEHFS